MDNKRVLEEYRRLIKAKAEQRDIKKAINELLIELGNLVWILDKEPDETSELYSQEAQIVLDTLNLLGSPRKNH